MIYHQMVDEFRQTMEMISAVHNSLPTSYSGDSIQLCAATVCKVVNK